MQKIHFNHVTEDLRGIFTPLDFNLAVPSILSGNTPGLLYADDLHQPSVAAGLVQTTPVPGRLSRR